MALSLKYTGPEAIQMLKDFYPKDWNVRITKRKETLLRIMKTHNLTAQKAYMKFIVAGCCENSSIEMFAALYEIMKIENMSNSDKSKRVLELEEIRKQVANQIVSNETSKRINDEDKKILRAYYNGLQQKHTTEIDELINSFEVIAPKLVIHQHGLFQ